MVNQTYLGRLTENRGMRTGRLREKPQPGETDRCKETARHAYEDMLMRGKCTMVTHSSGSSDRLRRSLSGSRGTPLLLSCVVLLPLLILRPVRSLLLRCHRSVLLRRHLLLLRLDASWLLLSWLLSWRGCRHSIWLRCWLRLRRGLEGA